MAKNIRMLNTASTRLIALLLAAICVLAGCGTGSGEIHASTDDATGNGASVEKLQIVATIFPEYDWAREIVGDSDAATVTLLVDNGVDLHSYQPSVKDILTVSGCDLLIYVGGESDQWVDDALREAVNPDMVTVKLLDALGDLAKEEEELPGLQTEGTGGAGIENDSDSEEPELDEHVWLSLRNAEVLTGAITDALCGLDPEHAALYRENAGAYQEQLRALDEAYQDMTLQAPLRTLVFGDRFPFRYLTDDYGLSYYAAFSGCEAETEASFETITLLSEKLDELGLHSILTIDGSDQRIAKTIVQNTKTKDQNVLVLDSMQSVTAKQIRDGVSYLEVMTVNYAVLKEALGN